MPWLFVLLTLALTSALAYFTYRSAQILPTLPPDANVVLSLPDVVTRAALCLICVGLGRLSGVGSEPLGWSPPARAQDALLGVGLGVVGAVVLFPVTQWAARRFGPSAYSDLLLRFVVPRTPRQWLLTPPVFALAVLLEELWFRSLLLGAMSRVLAVSLGASDRLLLPLLVLLGAALFGWLHAPQGWLGMLLAALLGLGLSLLFLARQSLLAPFLAHWVFNLLQLVRAARLRDWPRGA